MSPALEVTPCVSVRFAMIDPPDAIAIGPDIPCAGAHAASHRS